MTEPTQLRPLAHDTHARLTASSQRLPETVASALARYYALIEQIYSLEMQGLTNASIYLRQNKYMYLIHPTQPGGSRLREYIGADPVRQSAARARLDRFVEHQRLTQAANAARSALEQAADQIERILSALKDQ